MELTGTNWPCGLTILPSPRPGEGGGPLRSGLPKVLHTHRCTEIRRPTISCRKFLVSSRSNGTSKVSGRHGGGETPVPIPNTAVKPSSADGTVRSLYGRVGRGRGIERRSIARCSAFFVSFAWAIGTLPAGGVVNTETNTFQRMLLRSQQAPQRLPSHTQVERGGQLVHGEQELAQKARPQRPVSVRPRTALSSATATCRLGYRSCITGWNGFATVPRSHLNHLEERTVVLVFSVAQWRSHSSL